MPKFPENKKHRYGRRKRNSFQQFIHDIGKKLGRKPSHRKSTVEGSSLFSKSTEISYDEHGKISRIKKQETKYKRLKKPRFSLSAYLQEYRKKRKRAIEKNRKKKFKQKIQKKRAKEFRKEKRISYIRSFFPNYKKPKKKGFAPPEEETKTRDQRIQEKLKQQERNYFKYTINSLALYVTAYLIVYITYQLAVMIVASRWHLDSVLFYYDLAFNDFSPLWTRFNIIVVTFSGPLVSLLIGILFYKVIANRPKVKGFMKLFVIWIALHGFNLFFGAFASGVSTDQGFGYVANWLYMNVFWQIFFSLTFLFILGLIGYYSTGKFLETSNSAYRIKKENRNRFLLHQVILPWLIGGLLIYLVKVPNNMPYDVGNLLTMSLAVVPVIFNRRAKPIINFKYDKKPTKIHWAYIITFVLLLASFRIWLETGLHIELTYDISLRITPV
ncbi:MAG: hypothetical protein GXO89_01000 [Chlorobi bacterium]|nr:hypothetical protein [Chlorobiota bacterium]